MSFPKPKPIQDPSPEKAYLYAIRLLAKRDYSGPKMLKKLRDKGFDEEQCQYALNEIIAKNYLREDEYIRQKTKGWMYKGYSPGTIAMRFTQEDLKVEPETINLIFEENAVTPLDQIQWLTRKKNATSEIFESGEENYKKRQKVLAYIVGKGHKFDDALTALRAILHP
jgi:SOS response regulatory protein OraA/RecX